VSKIIDHEHDIGYSSIFSKKHNFLHFLKKYIQADWVNSIDESDLIPVDTSMIDDDYKQKESDVIYKLKFQGSEIIFYVLLELQSSVDYTMPFRLLRYMMLLLKREFDNALKNERESIDYRLPAIVPIILYNGSDKWTAVRSFKEYSRGYEQFGEYIIDFKYFLFDLNRVTNETILSTNELLDIIFALDKQPVRANIERMLNIAAEYMKRMSGGDRDDLLGWIRHIGLNRISDEKVKEELMNKFERGETTNMMYGIDMAFEEERQKGKLEGKLEGEKKAKIEIAKNLLDILDDKTIAKKTNLTIKEVEALRKDKSV
jgi:predicted transposase/invertase (TIGR01784 family)